MRMMKTGGFTPCDRRLDRRKVAIAAGAALCLFVATARAGTIDFLLDPNLSFMHVDIWYNTGASAGTPTQTTSSTGQGLGNPKPGATTPLNGRIYANVGAGFSTIQLLSGNIMHAAISGSWTPGENQKYVVVPNTQQSASFGLVSNPANGSTNGAETRIADTTGPLSLDVATAAQPVKTITAGSFSLSGVSLRVLKGANDLQVGTSNGRTLLDNKGIPLATLGSTSGTWDGTTLTIPIQSTMVSFTSISAIPTQMWITGQIVANIVVPEPSTTVLLGFGVVGLLSCAWRARKQRTNVA